MKLYSKYTLRQIVLLVILLIILAKLFSFRPISQSGLWCVVYFILLAFFIICFILSVKRSVCKSTIAMAVTAIGLLILSSFVPGALWGGQSVYYSLRGMLTIDYVPLFLFYFLVQKKIKEHTVEQAVLLLFLIYLAVYLFSIIIYPECLFGLFSEEQEELLAKDLEQRGTYRFSIPYENIITLVFLYFVNRRKKVYSGIILILAFLAMLTILRGTRTAIAVTFFMTAILYVKTSYIGLNPNKKRSISISKNKFILSAVSIVACCVMAVVFASKISGSVDAMFDTTQNEQSMGEDYVRIQMAAYYLFTYSHSLPEILFGHGIPCNGQFSGEIEEMSSFGFWPVDVGYVDIYLQFGLIGIIFLIFLLISVIRTKVQDDFLYAKYFIYYIYISMITGQYFLQNLALIAIALYLIYSSSEKRKGKI